MSEPSVAKRQKTTDKAGLQDSVPTVPSPKATDFANQLVQLTLQGEVPELGLAPKHVTKDYSPKPTIQSWSPSPRNRSTNLPMYQLQETGGGHPSLQQPQALTKLRVRNGAEGGKAFCQGLQKEMDTPILKPLLHSL